LENFISLERMRRAVYHLGRHTVYGVDEVTNCCVRQSNTRQLYWCTENLNPVSGANGCCPLLLGSQPWNRTRLVDHSSVTHTL